MGFKSYVGVSPGKNNDGESLSMASRSGSSDVSNASWRNHVSNRRLHEGHGDLPNYKRIKTSVPNLHESFSSASSSNRSFGLNISNNVSLGSRSHLTGNGWSPSFSGGSVKLFSGSTKRSSENSIKGSSSSLTLSDKFLNSSSQRSHYSSFVSVGGNNTSANRVVQSTMPPFRMQSVGNENFSSCTNDSDSVGNSHHSLLARSFNVGCNSGGSVHEYSSAVQGDVGHFIGDLIQPQSSQVSVHCGYSQLASPPDIFPTFPSPVIEMVPRQESVSSNVLGGLTKGFHSQQSIQTSRGSRNSSFGSLSVDTACIDKCYPNGSSSLPSSVNSVLHNVVPTLRRQSFGNVNFTSCTNDSDSVGNSHQSLVARNFSGGFYSGGSLHEYSSAVQGGVGPAVGEFVQPQRSQVSVNCGYSPLATPPDIFPTLPSPTFETSLRGQARTFDENEVSHSSYVFSGSSLGSCFQYNSEPSHNTANTELSFEINWDTLCSDVINTPQVRNPFFVFDGPRARINSISEYHVGNMNRRCNHCKAVYFMDEARKIDGVYTKCCMEGKIRITDVDDFPQYFKELITRASHDSSHFIQNIRRFNSAVAFSSFAFNSKPHVGRGPYSFNIEGTVHHLIAKSVNPVSGNDTGDEFFRKYCQLYLLDTEEATRVRLMHPANRNLHYDIMENIHKVLVEVNPYAAVLRNMHDVLLKEKEKSSREGRPPVEYSIRIFNSDDRRRDFGGAYNEITANETAVIYQSLDEDEAPGITNRAIHSKASDGVQILSQDDPRIDAFSYPLFFPRGRFGWNRNIAYTRKSLNDPNVKSRKFLSMQEYYKYLLQWRPSDAVFSPVLFGGKLTDQYVCDVRLRIEGRNLDYIRFNQAKLRVDSYRGLHDHLHSEAAIEGKTVGKVFVLPSTFVGSPRFMQGLFNDAMAMVTALGMPDFFITMTCNPKWPEITENLGFAKDANERKDIIVRVFQLKLDELFREIVDRSLFGKVIGYTYSIEFQKRGLPHAHILIILDKSCKPTNSWHVNKHVSAELPDEKIHPKLFEKVREFMIHGPCGPGAVCSVLKNNVLSCKKHFPKNFQSSTDFDVNSYPLYQRRDNRGMCEKWNGKVIDNSFVIPYNPVLLMKFNCHINVEVVSSISAIKYIYKYCFKGPDRVSFRVVSNNVLDYDEVNSYTTGRYLCPTEAFWRIFEFPTHGRSHTVQRLPVHDQLEQNVIFTEGEERAGLDKAILRDTQLMAYFKLNVHDITARELLYIEIPKLFRWDSKLTKWCKRKQIPPNQIVRLHSVSVRSVERHSVRCLLLHRKGCVSFEDLRTIDGVTYATFREAAVKLGLVKGCDYWLNIFDEAVLKCFPRGLRDLLVSISTERDNTFVPDIWRKYQTHFIEDFVHLGCSTEEACDRALQEISDGLRDSGLTLDDVKLPSPVVLYDSNLMGCVEGIEEIRLMCSQLNQDQLRAVVQIVNSVSRLSGKSFACFSMFFTSNNRLQYSRTFFLDGPGGTGKTFVYNLLCKMFDFLGIFYITVAPTGIAAVMLPNGRTAHSRFGIPMQLHNKSISSIDFDDFRASDLRRAQVIIWDEIGMTKCQMLDVTHRLLKDLRFDESGNRFTDAFGGCIVVAGGDFRQQGPVVKRGSRPDFLSASVKSSSLWPKFSKLELKVNMRAGEHNKAFNEFLLKIGNNSFDKPASIPEDYMHVPDEYLINSEGNKYALIDFIFGVDLSDVDPTHFGNRAILCPRNADALHMNEVVLSRLPGETVTILSSDSAQFEGDVNFDAPSEYLNSLTPVGCPPHKLNLKKNCIVMLLRNINPKIGLVNGTRLIVKNISDNILDCEILFGALKGQRVFVPKYHMVPTDIDLPFEFRRFQFPVRLSYSMTIAKSQGQSLDYVGIYLNSDSFCHGQIYTAFSRSKFPEFLKIDVVNSYRKVDGKTYIKNVVFKELL